MNQELLNKYGEKGLGSPFTIAKTGETVICQKGEHLKSKIAQMGTVIFETIGAVGRIKIETIEIVGNAKGLIIAVEDDNLIGTLFEPKEGLALVNLWNFLKELKSQPETIVKPEEKPKVKLPPNLLDEIKVILKEYLGDFTDRIYQNQFKAQRIKSEEFFEEDARRLIFALGKAAGMIIGPSKGKELTNKLLGKLK